MQTAFEHLNGYSAVYYTYMWSLVIAKDMFTEFKTDGIVNPQVAAKYRDTVLAPSGTKPAADLVRDFLGRPYSFKAYDEWLTGNEHSEIGLGVLPMLPPWTVSWLWRIPGNAT